VPAVVQVTANLHLIETVLAFTAVVGMVLVLRRLSIVREEHSQLFARLLTQAILPVVVFHQLVTQPIHQRQLLPVFIIILTGVLSMALSWLLGRALKLDRAKIGALILTSSFGSSAFLGYSVIQYVFPGDSVAMTDAILISELGVGLPIFVFGPVIAMHFGSAEYGPVRGRAMLVEYFRSPVFVAVVLGLALAPLRLDTQRPLFAPVFEALGMMEGALAVLVCFTLGLQLKMQSLKGLWVMLVVSALIQMAFQPFAAGVLADLLAVTGTDKQVLILISAMPSAVLGTVFATRYNCAGATASILVMCHILLGTVLIPLSFSLAGAR
jgi:malate permease and related proteins